MNILLIEDNFRLAQQVAEFLNGLGHQVDHASNGAFGIELALTQPFDLIVLDLMLPDISGFGVCQQIKTKTHINVPILMLTARDAIEDKTQGFDCGADDYLTKPFDLRELALRCNALTKRQQLFQTQEKTLGPLQLNFTDKSASRDGKPLSLNQTSFAILALLVEAYPQPVSRAVLFHKLWPNEAPNTDALKSHIYHLRKVLDKPFAQPLVKTITNLGYKLELTNTLSNTDKDWQ